MLVTACNVEEVVKGLAAAAMSGKKVTGFDLRKMNRVQQYTPEDMTVTAEAGITLGELQQKLAEGGQWLPIDPPHAQTLTIGSLLAGNKSGPRRYGHGTIREYLLGMKVVLADGRVITAGGKVVKNVAGYDLCKLFVGSRGTLGVIVEATFKVLPRPESEVLAGVSFDTPTQLPGFLEKLGEARVTPVILDLYGGRESATLVVGFAGTREDVEWQLRRAREIGLSKSLSLDYEQRFWSSPEPPHRLSVLPSKISATLAELAAESYVTRAGNGVIYYRGSRAPANPNLPHELMQRIKDTYDPKHLLPDLPW